MSNLNLAIGTMVFEGPDALRPVLDLLKSSGIVEIDTAQMYGTNEADLGATKAASMGFAISTKNYGGWKKGVALKRDAMLQTTQESLEKLGVDQVDIFYIHGPDRTMELDEWVPTLQEIYEKGAFKRFGLSNFSEKEVRDIWEYNKAKGYVLPTAYQGNYNAVSRHIETTLFPTLQELKIAFYAYSPIAGGFLTKSTKALKEGAKQGRFSGSGHLSEMYRSLYYKPQMLDALDKWEALAEKQGVPKAELAYRWVYYHSSVKPELGDHLILGASRLEQITSSVEGLKRGPLDKDVVKGIDEIWDLIKDVAIVDNFDATQT